MPLTPGRAREIPTDALQVTTVYLQWDRHGHFVGQMQFPATTVLHFVDTWRQRVADKGGWTVKAG